MKATIDELEATLNAVVSRLQMLADENAHLRAELAASQVRMRAAGFKLRAVAERIPCDVADASASEVAPVAQEKAA